MVKGRKISKQLFRSIYYFRVGYGLYLAYPVALAAYASSVYYLAVKSIPFLEEIFPDFSIFLAFSVLLIPPVGILLGWLHFKGRLSMFFKAEQDIMAEANPYSTEITTLVNLSWLEALSGLCKLHGIETKQLDELIKKTREKFGVEIAPVT